MLKIFGFLFLICFVHQLICDEQNICDLASDKSIVNKIQFTDKIDYRILNVINYNSIGRNNCIWDITATTGKRIIDLSRIILSSNDNFKITLENHSNNTTNNLTIYDYHKQNITSSGLVFLNNNQFKLELELDQKEKNFKRTFEIILYNNYDSVYLMKDSGKLTFPINQLPSIISSESFTLKPNPIYSDRLIILTFTNKKLTTEFSIDGKPYGQKNDLPDIYMGKIDGIKIDFKNFSSGVDVSIEMNYWLVTSSCSKEIIMDDKNSTKSIIYPNEQNRYDNYESMICAQIFTNNNNKYYQVMITNNTTMLPNPSDLISIYDLPKMTLMQTIQSSFISILKNINTFLESKKILVIYDSPFSTSKDNKKIIPIQLSLTNNMSYILDQNSPMQTINIDKTKTETKFIFNIYSTITKNLIVLIEPQESLEKNEMNIEIYDTDLYGTEIKPIVSLKQLNVLPSMINVDKSEMRIEIWGKLSKIKFTVKHVDDNDKNCHTVSTFNPSFIVSSNNHNCSWFIPNNDNNDMKSKYTILSANSLHLPNNSWLQITRLDKKSETNKINGPLNEKYLPDFVMSSSYNYLIEFFSNSDKKNDDNVNIFIMKKPYFLNDTGIVNINDNINEHKFSFKSIYYPGLYPIGFEQSTTFKNNNNQTILITVNDVDLYDHHWIWMGTDDLFENLTSKNIDIDQIPDYFVQTTFFVAFNTKKSNIFGHSGRGYNIEMTTFGCGGVIDLNENKKLTFTANNSYLQDNPRCIWKIIDSKPKQKNLNETILNFNISLSNDDNNAIMKIYDSISLRNSSIHFALCNETKNNCLNDKNKIGHYQGSIGMAYIVYDFSKSLTMKKDYSFEMTIESTKCVNEKYNLSTCTNGQRCITELMSCNNLNDCGDWSDELYCRNGSFVPPKPNGDGGDGHSTEVNIFVVLFILMPLSAILGIIGYIYLPRLLTNVRYGRYSEFRSDMSEVS